jgi:dTDP-4-amino-4,6-dideoxygalactose transaminase
MADLRAQYHSLKPEIDAAVLDLFESTAFISGPAVSKFEAEFADYCGTKYAVGVASGSAALRLALRALDIGPGDEVITTTWTFFATVEAIAQVGATPVLVDIDPATYNIDPDAVRRAVTERTKAIIPVHLFGQPADMSQIMAIAEENGLRVVEDAAQSHGAFYEGKRTGSIGDIGCFSFYPAKNLGAFGDGGIITVSNTDVADRLRRLRDHGRTGKYQHSEYGEGERLDSVQAAVLSIKLKRLEGWNERRAEIAATYNRMLAPTGVVVPAVEVGATHVYHLYVARVPRRDEALTALREAGVQAAVHYPVSLHLQPALTHLGYGLGSMPVSEQASGEVISLPIYPEMTDEQVGRVINVIMTSIGS